MGRIPANCVYRLPTEAEWEYACRAWTSTRFSCWDDPGPRNWTTYGIGFIHTNLTNYAWYWDNSDHQTHPVGQKLPNPWGLHDMHGNVWEWCLDWWVENLSGGIMLDPPGPETGSLRVARGGGYYNTAKNCRSARRGPSEPDFKDAGDGLRVVLAPGQP